MSKILIYLHGLGSKGQTPKSEAMKAALAADGVEVIAPDLPLDPAEVIRVVRQIIVSKYYDGGITKLVFCGTSLGGFYATYFGETFDCCYVAVNPVLSPSEAFKRHIDNPPMNYATGQPLKFRDGILEEFAKLEKETAKPSGYLANLFLAMDDDVVPYKPVLERNKHASFVMVTEDGGHRYDANWHKVIERMRKLFA